MITKVSEPVSVSLIFNCKKNSVFPSLVVWNNRPYRVSKVGLHHTYREGRCLYHVFSVIAGNLFFRLVFNTENLHWKVEGVEDGV